MRPRTSGASKIILLPTGIDSTRVENLLRRLATDRLAALRAMRHADAGHQQPQIVVNLGDRRDRAARVLRAGALVDRNRRLQAVDQVDVGPLQLREELPDVDREASRRTAAALRRTACRTPASSCRSRSGPVIDDQPIAREIDVDVLQVVNPGAANANHRRRADLTVADRPLSSGSTEAALADALTMQWPSERKDGKSKLASLTPRPAVDKRPGKRPCKRLRKRLAP